MGADEREEIGEVARWFLAVGAVGFEVGGVLRRGSGGRCCHCLFVVCFDDDDDDGK